MTKAALDSVSRVDIVPAIAALEAKQWDALWPDNPFVRHGILAAFERSGVTQSETGWRGHHLVIRDRGADGQVRLVAAMPLYLKFHSYGEYVFDWSWAEAYQHSQLEYYPKFLNAIPFTPSVGPRLGFASDLSDVEKAGFAALLLDAVKQWQSPLLSDTAVSGFHGLFPCRHSQLHFRQHNFMERHGYQFHWFNQGYESFDDFLATFVSRKRKNLKKEREKVREQGIHVTMRPATEVSTEEWKLFFALYHRTYVKNSGRLGYLNEAFFQQLIDALPHNVLLATAYRDDLMLAGALYFRDNECLYGRYWGTREDIDGLHFETCYYTGIEYAIAHGLKRFDPGAQGEHKIQRGFVPIKTCSFHALSHPQFQAGIQQFVTQERLQVTQYIEDARGYLPFRQDVTLPTADYYLSE